MNNSIPLFDQYWHPGPPPPRKAANDRPPVNPLGVVTRQKRSLLTFASSAQEASDQTREDEEVAGASLQETLRRTDFSTIPMSQLEELEQLTRRLAEQLSTRLSRRQRLLCILVASVFEERFDAIYSMVESHFISVFVNDASVNQDWSLF